jgi:hypothetical protein
MSNTAAKPLKPAGDGAVPCRPRFAVAWLHLHLHRQISTHSKFRHDPTAPYLKVPTYTAKCIPEPQCTHTTHLACKQTSHILTSSPHGEK